MPGEDRVGLVGLLGQQLVVVDRHAVATQLLGDVGCPTLIDVALPGREVPPGQHHVDDGVVGGVASVVPGHVAEVLTRDLDLAPQEAVVVDLELSHLLLGEHPGQVDVAVLLEASAIVLVDAVAAVVIQSSHRDQLLPITITHAAPASDAVLRRGLPSRLMDEQTFVDAHGVEVSTRWWTVDAPTGVVLVSHGASEHSGCYD